MDIFRQIPLSQLDDSTLVTRSQIIKNVKEISKLKLLINTISTASPISKAELDIDSQTTLDVY